jgi:hypothetical protein
MIRSIFAAATLIGIPLGTHAGETIIRLNMQPMPAPTPALKYLLLPEVGELNPGNPAHGYVRCFAEQQNFFFNKQSVSDRIRYQTMPLKDLPKEMLRNYGGSALRHADWSARLDNPDWQILRRVQHEGIDLVIPELEPLRALGAALQVRFRAEVADRRYDDAVRSAKTLLAFARHLGMSPALAANLVGLSVANLALDTLEEMVQQPGCPNLYWALTDLPDPLVDLRKGLQGDHLLVANQLRPLRNDLAMTESELEEFVSALSGRMGFAREQAGQAPWNLRTQLAARVKNPDRVQAARARLIEVGCAAAGAGKFAPAQVILETSRVTTFPPAQVILLDEKREWDLRRDEAVKILALAPWQIDSLPGGATKRSRDCLFTDLLPQVMTNRRQQARLEQRIGLLRLVEAVRMYAAAHDGKLPPTPADIGLPLPNDPFTGKAFAYKVEGGAAHLAGGAPRDEQRNHPYNVWYQVTMR